MKELELAKKCIEIIGQTLCINWDRIIIPALGNCEFAFWLPKDKVVSFDLNPKLKATYCMDYIESDLPFMEKSIVIGRPPYGRANKESLRFLKVSLSNSPYVAFLQPISQLNDCHTVKNAELISSVDIGLHVCEGQVKEECFNIYRKVHHNPLA